MPPAHGQLSSLVSLITDATKIVEAHFAKSSKPYVPSLDDTEPHPLDILSDSMELRVAIQTIQGACAQLSATVARPSHTIFNKVVGSIEPACFDIVTAYKIPDILQEQPAKGLHVSEIAKRTGLHQAKIERIMRLLATKHVFRESSDGVFVNNRLSVELMSTNPMVNIVKYNTEEVCRAIPYFREVLGDKEWGHSVAPNQTTFNRHTGYTKTMFEYYSGEDSLRGAELGARFGVGMIAWGVATESGSVVYEFPWGDLPKGTTVVDIGSGIGTTTIQLAKNHPHLQLTLQDLPERMVQAKEDVWPKECPEALAEGRVNFVAIDFFTQAPILGADIYYLKSIIHDWQDEQCITILTNVRKAMVPHSRLLIHEYIVQDVARVPDYKSIFRQAPEPLLPNYGVGRVLPYAADIAMMIMTNGAERRLQAYLDLAAKVNLRFVKLWDLGETSIVEFGLSNGGVGCS